MHFPRRPSIPRHESSRRWDDWKEFCPFRKVHFCCAKCRTFSTLSFWVQALLCLSKYVVFVCVSHTIPKESGKNSRPRSYWLTRRKKDNSVHHYKDRPTHMHPILWMMSASSQISAPVEGHAQPLLCSLVWVWRLKKGVLRKRKRVFKIRGRARITWSVFLLWFQRSICKTGDITFLTRPTARESNINISYNSYLHMTVLVSGRKKAQGRVTSLPNM